MALLAPFPSISIKPLKRKTISQLAKGMQQIFLRTKQGFKKVEEKSNMQKIKVVRISISSISDLMSDQCVQLTDCRDLSSREKEMLSKKAPSFIRRYSSRPVQGCPIDFDDSIKHWIEPKNDSFQYLISNIHSPFFGPLPLTLCCSRSAVH